MKTRKGATVLISTIVHVVLVVVMILIPLISYSELPQQQLLAFLVAPPPPPPPPPPPVVEAAPQPVIVKTVQIDPGAMVAPTEIPKDIVIVRDEGPPPSAVGIVGGTGRSGMLSGVLGGVLKAQEEAAPPPPPPPPP
ncbi:MAG: energy transducer TonB, partial [Acidobacteria bacterium]|nr:energy transducer TonB [Acidobacteriota bacterium]